MYFFENLIQYFFFIILLLLLFFYILIVLAIRRAVNLTAIPVPTFWKLIMIINFLLIVGSLIFILSQFLL